MTKAIYFTLIGFLMTSEILSVELINNGDFSSGNVGFTSDYKFSESNFGVGKYVVTTNPQKHHAGFAKCSDHTNDSAGLMMIFDSYTTPNKLVWSQTVEVNKNNSYIFSMWATKLVYYEDSYLQIKINGKAEKNLFHVSKSSCTWSYYEFEWVSGNNDLAKIEIFNLTTNAGGNDLAIDDISFEGSLSNIDPDFDDKIIFLCPSQSVSIGYLNEDIDNFDFYWYPHIYLNEYNIPNPKSTPESDTKYQVTITNKLTGKSISRNVEVKLYKTTIPKLWADPDFLCQDTVVIEAEPGFKSYKWSTGEVGKEITVNKEGVYTLTVTDSNGCETSNQITIYDKSVTIKFPEVIYIGELCYGSKNSNVNYYIDNNSTDTIYFEKFELITGLDCFELIDENESKLILPNSKYGFKIELKDLAVGKYRGFISYKTLGDCSVEGKILVEVEIVEFEIDLPDSLFVCLGSSINIGVESENHDYDYIWSPSDYLNNPSLSNPLSTPPSNIRYFVKRIDKLTGCIALDTVEIILFNSQIEISASVLAVCQDPVELTASDGYQEYNWSNGKKGRIIKIMEGGTYSVTAIDSNGCESYAEIEIGNNNNNLMFPDEIDLGTICLGSGLSKEIKITNIENDKVIIDTIHLINNANFKISIPLDNNDTLKQGDSYSFQVLSKFDDVGFYTNEILISLKFPCPTEYRIKLIANVLDNKVHIFLPDTTVAIGDNIRIPVAAYSECYDSELTANYRMTVLVNKTLFKPESVETGRIISITELDKNTRVVFEDRTNTKTITTNKLIINYLCGLVMFGEVSSSNLIIEEFDFENPITVIKHNGSISTDICEFDIRQIKLLIPTKFEILQNDYSDKIILKTGSGEEGSFSIKIMDLTGTTVYNHSWQKSNQLYEEKFIPVNSINFSKGVYMIIFQTPWSIKTEKLLIMN